MSRSQACLALAVGWALMSPAVAPTIRASAVKADEQVVLYPALARPLSNGWEIEIHGLIYEPEGSRLVTGLVRRLLGLEEDELTREERAIFRTRLGYFLVDNERDKTITMLAGEESLRFGISGPNGHFTGRWNSSTNKTVFASWSNAASNGTASLVLPLAQSGGRSLPVDVHFLSETGLSVISDIDDTIKISEVRDHDALLKNTFCRPFRPVPGMAARYRQWQRANQAQFHYVTASPWQLYLPLAQFALSNEFPAGTFHMKEFRVKDRTVLSLFGSPEAYKPAIIAPLLESLPRRAFVLIGDSGEKDPEIYGDLARRYPEQIRRILIRNVTDEDAEAPRYGQAFREVPRQLWQVFSEPAELPDQLVP